MFDTLIDLIEIFLYYLTNKIYIEIIIRAIHSLIIPRDVTKYQYRYRQLSVIFLVSVSTKKVPIPIATTQVSSTLELVGLWM